MAVADRAGQVMPPTRPDHDEPFRVFRGMTEEKFVCMEVVHPLVSRIEVVVVCLHT